MLGERIAVLVAAGGAGWEASALSRLAAAGPGVVLLKRCVDLSDLLATASTGQARVAVNRTRSSLGWGEKEVRAMIEGFVTPASLHFLPEDRAAADHAVVAGKSLVELGDSALRRSLGQVVDAVTGTAAPGARRRARPIRRRRAGTAR